LTELEREPSGRLNLPNLVIGMPISIVVRIRVPPQKGQAEPCRFVLDWDEPGGRAPGRRSQVAALALPSVPARRWSELPIDSAVAEQVALLMAASARKEVIAAIDRGDATTARSWLNRIRQLLAGAPKSVETDSDKANAFKTDEYLVLGQIDAARKSAHYQQYHRKRGHDTAF
jgi:hypothetical protein